MKYIVMRTPHPKILVPPLVISALGICRTELNGRIINVILFMTHEIREKISET